MQSLHAMQRARAIAGVKQAALGDCLLAAMDTADKIPGAQERLNAILDDARINDAAHVEVFALDALARTALEQGDIDNARVLSELADRRMESASHFITDRDRTDAHTVREHLAPKDRHSTQPSGESQMSDSTQLANADTP